MNSVESNECEHIGYDDVVWPLYSGVSR